MVSPQNIGCFSKANIILIQETMCLGDKEMISLEIFLKDWSLSHLDDDCHSGGLISRRSPNYSTISSSHLPFTILMKLKFKDLNYYISVSKVYGPYTDCILREDMVMGSAFSDLDTILGGD